MGRILAACPEHIHVDMLAGMVQVKTEVQAALLLDFDLPGVTWTGHGGHGQAQLEQRFGEHWQMRVSPANGAATAATLRQLADAIDAAMKGIK